MKKRTLVLLAAILLVGSVALGLLRAYQLELIQMIVVNAVVQKAPSDFPADQIRSRFDEALQVASKRGEENQYLGELLNLSRRLEKVQNLSHGDVAQILEDLRKPRKANADAAPSQGAPEPVLPWAGEVRSLSDRDGPSTLSKLRAYHPVRFCDPVSSSFETDAASGTDSFFGEHFFDGCGPDEPGRLEGGTPPQAAKTRPGQGDRSQE